LRHPIVADRLYGGKETLERSDIAGKPRQLPLAEAIPADDDDSTPGAHRSTTAETLIARQALHAHRLEFNHPVTDARLKFEAPLPADFCAVLAALRQA
jgi:23S rRNA pseudouridine1911/1915/1917 synthase